MQRYFCFSKQNNIFELSNEDSYHVKKVMRMKVNDEIEVVYQEKVYLCKIIDLIDIVIVEIIKELNTYNELGIKVTICQSLVKENKMDLILQKCVELGTYSFIPLITKNSIIKLDKNANKKVKRWQSIVECASCQSKRNIIPKVFNPMNIYELVKLDYDLKILCTVNELSRSLKKILQNNLNCDTMIIVVGPEGGFKKEEEEFLIKNGYLSAFLLDFVLRTETAGIVALSMINYELVR